MVEGPRQPIGPPASGDRWSGLRRTGTVAAGVVVALLLGEIAVFAMFPRPASALEHFQLFQRNPLVGLLTMDLLGGIAYLFLIPTMLALFTVVRRHGEGASLVAIALYLVGIAEFFATNTGFAVLDLSNRYFAAQTAAERASLLAAGEAMFTLFNENAFLTSYVIVSASWCTFGAVMLRDGSFGAAASYSGVLAGACGILAVVIEHLSAALVPVAVPVYFAAIVFLIVWIALTGRRLARDPGFRPGLPG